MLAANKAATFEEGLKRKKELKKALGYAKGFINTVREPLILLYPALHIKTASQSFYKSFKVKQKDADGKLIFDVGNGDWNIPLLRRLLDRIQKKGIALKDVEVEHHFKQIGRKVMLLNASKLSLNDKSEEIILLAIKDITDKKLFNASFEADRKTVLENIPSAVIISDAEHKITYCNKKAEHILNKKVKSIIGNNILKVFPKNVIPDFQKQYLKIAATNTPAVFEQYYHPLTIWLQVRVFPSQTGMSIYLDDISRRIQTEKHLEELSKQKDEFIGIASHELKTPVTSIKGYTQILKIRFAQEKNMRAVEMLTRMDRQIDKLTFLINDLLDVTKIEGGKFQFHRSYFDFNELVAEIAEEIQQTTSAHTIITKLALTSKIYGDKERIGQVITNFLSNAIKYSPNSAQIILTTLKEARRITLCVQDFGIGISKEKQEKVFDRFFRVSGSKEDTFPGLGLGLFISAEIIKRHNGTVSVKSIKNKGSTFCFSLPVKNQIVKKYY
jgi:two-component system CheB/CheR fusion protein